jgi:predicted helicase
MSQYAIREYRNEVEKIIHYGGTKKETAIRNAFYVLLNKYADTRELKLIPEISLRTKAGRIVTPDGTLKNILRLDHGYWESKDESDDIDEEIRKKFAKGYPNENILFEDSQTAVLVQQGDEVLRVPMENEEELDKLLNRFVQYERKEVTEFREAIEHFKEDIPKVTEAIKAIIDKQNNNDAYLKALAAYHEMCKVSINPDIAIDDVKEMMLQHILSADIFNTIFDEPHFHQENNIASELNKVVETFFTGTARRQTLGKIKHYYDTINAAAASIADHHEKQKFLKVVYENFYKAYNPKAADRLGIVYTPNEIVQFMIRSTDYLLHKHFGKTLDSKKVDILDPATGTGTFICDIIDYLPKHKLEYKYKNELHANEVAILPYYIANLNIEYVYKQKMGSYAEFENLCFVDTLDKSSQHFVQAGLFSVSAENATRIKKQNERKISVIIGNPPYNANQQNFSDFNKNREYNEIDKRIKETYVKKSNATKTKVYDMYARFFRWASDRIHQDGIICFITNNSFLNTKGFDGFRKSIQDEFQFAYFIDLGGNIRELSGKDGIFLNEDHTIFGQAAAVGIAISFLIKDSRYKYLPCKINYVQPCDIRATRDEKLAYINVNKVENIPFENITPDKNNNWIHLVENDFDGLIPLRNPSNSNEQIFGITFLGVSTNRDEWVYDFDKSTLKEKIQFFGKEYNSNVQNDLPETSVIKWSRDLRNKKLQKRLMSYDERNVCVATYRPFIKKYQYADKISNDVLTQKHYDTFGNSLNLDNRVVCFASYERRPFSILAFSKISNLNYFGDPANCLPHYRYTASGERIDNITDWAFELFFNHYLGDEEKASVFKKQWRAVNSPAFSEGHEPKESGKPETINKIDIFHYIYAVLHHPAYRKKYELNLKREFPRIPLYDNFPQWCKWGQALMQLHINYEAAEPYPLTHVITDYTAVNEAAYASFQKPKLRADKLTNKIVIDGFDELRDIPAIAWEYKLGNRSALEWILDQYKEKKPSDPTIAEKFNTYKFTDYKDKVIDLLLRVCTVSVETMNIIKQMPESME